MGPCCLLGGSLPPPRRGGEVCRRNPHNGREVLALSSSAPSEMPAARGANINHRQRRLKCKESPGTEQRQFPCTSQLMRAEHQRADSHGPKEGHEQAAGLHLLQPVPRVLRKNTHLILRYSYSPLSPLLPSAPHLHTPGAEQGLAVILARFLSQGSRGTGLAWHGHAVGFGRGQTAHGSGNALSGFF